MDDHVTWPLSRLEVRQVACPECGAKVGQMCWKKGGRPRVANHRSRIKAAEAALQPVVPAQFVR